MPLVLGLALAQSTITAVDLGLALAVRTVGFLVAVPAGGVLADRYSRRATIGWSGALAAVGTAAISAGLAAGLAAGPGPGLVLLLAGSALAGAGQGACRPAFQAMVAEIVDEPRRQQANAAVTIAVRVSTLLAPAGAALAATVLPIPVVCAATAVLWVVAAAVPPSGTHVPDPVRPGGRLGILAEFADGLREARRHPWFLAGLGALTAVIAFGYSVTGVVLPLVSRDTYGGAAVLAAGLTGYTAGALAGAVLMSRWRPVRRGWLALGGLALYAVVPLVLLVPVPAWVVVAAFVVCGAGIELFNVPWFTAVQREADPATLARLSSLDFLVSYGLAPVGLALIAPAITAFGLVPVLLVCAVVCLAGPGSAALAPGARRFSAA
jgi:MFS family permease